MIFTSVFLLVLLASGLLFPVWKKPKPRLPVLRYGRTELPGQKPILDNHTLDKQFGFLHKKGFTAVLPQELETKKGQLHTRVKKPVILVFYGGYQTFYTRVFPLLQKWKLKAVVGLPVSLIGTYDAWHNPQKSPWQNLLTAEQISVLHQSGLVSFAPHGLEYANPNALSGAALLAQAAEARHRLQQLYKLPAQAFLFTHAPHDPDLPLRLTQAGYAFSVTPQTGNNPLPAGAALPLQTFPMSKHTFLPRLYLRMTR